MIDRIRKLFAMSQDTSSLNEAEIALKRCKSLMEKYGITEADLQTSEFGTDFAYVGKRLDKWKSFLSVGIAAFTNTIVTIQYVRDENNRTTDEKGVVYKGFDADVLNAVLLSDYLEHTLERCVKAYKAETRDNSRAGATSFRNGFAVALQRRMVEMSEEMEEASPETSNGTSLVVCKMQMVNDEFGKQKISRTRSRTSSYAGNSAGQRAGNNVNLNRQMTGGNQKRIA